MDDSQLQNQDLKQYLKLIMPEIRCKIHQNSLIESINLNLDYKNLLVCQQCAQYDEIKNNDLVVLKEFFSKNSQNILKNWPPLQDQKLIQQLNNKELLTDKTVVLVSQITQLFKQFRKDISNIIDDQEKKILDQIYQIEFSRDNFLQSYHKICDKEEIIELFLSKSSNLEELEESLKNIVLKKQRQCEEIEQLFRHQLESFTQNKQKYSFDNFENLIQQIKQNLKSVDFLNHTSNDFKKDIQDNLHQLNQKIKQEQNLEQQIQTQKQKKCELKQELLVIDFYGNLSLLFDYHRIKIKMEQYHFFF